jgi:dolichol-phosphate hexosyltransferase
MPVHEEGLGEKVLVTQRVRNSPTTETSFLPPTQSNVAFDDSSACPPRPGESLTGPSIWHEGPHEMTSEVPYQTALPKLSILMCAFNEERTIIRAIHEVLGIDYPCEMELIVVDDGSTDATAKLVEQVDDPRVILYRHDKNRGKGTALRSASSLASGTYILPFDADLEYSPKDILRLIDPILSGRFEVVYGVRLFGYNTVYQSYRYAIGNRLLTTTANVLFDAYLSDLHTCLKLMPLATFKSLVLREPGFGLDTELTACLLRLGIRPFEVPVSYYSRSHAQGKKINWRDALACLRILLRVRTRRIRRLTVTITEPVPGETVLPVLRQGGRNESASHGLVKLAAFDPGDHADGGANAIAAG